MKKKNGFTLIEILAVIIILGILMIIAVPAVTRYIDESRKEGYISSAKSIISGTTKIANSEELGINDKDTTYYIPAGYIKTEKNLKSPYGDFTEAYVGVTVEDDGYDYFWVSNDDAGKGIKVITGRDALESSLVESDVKDADIRDTVETTGINNRPKIKILNPDGTWQEEREATKSLNPNGKVETADLLNAMFLSGPEFNTKIKILAGATGDNVSPSKIDETITRILRSDEEPTEQNKQAQNLVSTPESEVPIYAWFENGTIYWWTEDVMPNMNEDAQAMFYQLLKVVEIDLDTIKTDRTTNMEWLFGRAHRLENLDLSNFDTSKVITMAGIFCECRGLSQIDLSHFNTSNVTSMSYMFYSSAFEELDLSHLDTSKVIDMSYMFGNLPFLESLDVSVIDTRNVTNMEGMFAYNYGLKSLNLSNFNTSNVTNMAYMFSYVTVIKTLNLSSFNTSNVINMSGMFSGAGVESLDLSNFDTRNVNSMIDMFSLMDNIKTLDLSSFDTRNVRSMRRMFVYSSKLESINVSSFNTSNVVDMYAIFDACPSLKTIDVSNFDTRNVTNMGWMFSCDDAAPGQLTEIIGLQNLNTSNATIMEYMFFNQGNLHTLDISNFDTSKVKNMEGMFAASNFETIYVSPNFVTSGVTNSSNMFSRSLRQSTGSNEYVLTGGAGTTFDPSHVDKTYARIDDPTNGRPGYFTLKAN